MWHSQSFTGIQSVHSQPIKIVRPNHGLTIDDIGKMVKHEGEEYPLCYIDGDNLYCAKVNK